jgi:hypothetical protein
MSDQSRTFQQQPMQFPVPQPAPPQPPKHHPLASRVAFGLYGLVVGLVLGSLAFAGGASEPTTVAGPTKTVTVTSAPQASEAPTTSAPAGYSPKASDWKVGVKVKEKQCFGEAGCNVTVSIHPQYTGDRELPTTGTIEVTYEISGDESGPVVQTFTVTGGDQVSYDKSADLSTSSSGVTPKAKVTDVTYSE